MATVTPTPTSKYAEERSVYTSLETLRANKEAQAEKDGNYASMFTDQYDKFKADSNNDGNIDYNEYKSYIISSYDDKKEILQSNRQEDNNNNTNQNYYHFDSSLLIAIGMICITTIIVTWVKRMKLI